jgi:ATP-dependent Clp protease ATP-binding subunit ClpA
VLGLVDEPGGLAAQAIVAQGVAGDTVRAVLRAALAPAVEAVPAHVPFSADAKKLLGLTLREALRLGHNYIGTEHILLALLGDEQTPGGALLGALGVERVATEAWLAEAFEALAQQRHR